MSAKRVAGTCAAVVAAALWLCQAASAGTVGYLADPNRGQPESVVLFTAAPGETNDTTVTLTPTTAVITDLGNPLHPDPAYPDTARRCVFKGDKAECTTGSAAPFIEAIVDLGDGNDTGRVTVAAQANPAAVGDLEAGAIYGGPGNDKLIGSAGDDWLDGGPGADDIDGGGGVRDFASYSNDGDQTTGVTVTLDGVANDGHPGEHDNVRGDVEDVDGTLHGSNTLIGNVQDNALFGHYGSDTVRGGGGNDELHGSLDPGPGGTDVLDGGLGLDTFFGSDGNDVIYARDHLPDLRISCNGGYDVVYDDSVDTPDADCEEVHTG